jgi:hypothetical protein
MFEPSRGRTRLRRETCYRIVVGVMLVQILLSLYFDDTVFAKTPAVKIVPTAAEKVVINAAAGDSIASFGPDEDAAHGEKWGPDRTLRAELIYALAAETNTEWPVQSSGLYVYAARIVGYLDLTGTKIHRPLQLINCYFQDPISLTDADTSAISFNGHGLSCSFRRSTHAASARRCSSGSSSIVSPCAPSLYVSCRPHQAVELLPPVRPLLRACVYN